MHRAVRSLAAIVLPMLALASGATAQPTVDPAWPSFPGALRHPSSAVSAALALDDRWLGDAPFDNPALLPQRQIVVSPAMVRVSRQDLRANNRNMDETPAFLDLAGAWAALAIGPVATFAYLDQPVLRLEASAFTVGRNSPDPFSPPPANVTLDFATRELRAGAGASFGAGPWRIGIAGEWTSRSDRDQVTVESGAPTGNGTALSDLTGSGFGGQVGARVSLPLLRPDGLTIGVGARTIPSLTIEGDTLEITREAGWEAGLSARARVSESIALLAAAGGAGATDWTGLDVTTGATRQWGLAFEYHDPQEPWTARFGFGQERQDDVPEPRAGRIGLGFGWNFGGSTLDVGAMRRNLEREGKPDSYDDRVIASLSVKF